MTPSAFPPYKVFSMKAQAIHRHKMVASLFLLAVSAGIGSAYAAEAPVHVRGTVEMVNSDGFTVATPTGVKTIHMTSKTKVAGVVPSDLKAIKPGTFIGTANIEHRGTARALEIVVFPASMKGTGLGDYAWDLPAKNSGGSSAMTNGTVKSSLMGGAMMNSSMTNGTVKKASAAGEMKLVVDYGKGQKIISVPSNVPVVAFQPADKSVIVKGQHVFVVANQGTSMEALFVAAGLNGTVPPM
jgi:hypothetical protein